MFGRGEHVRRLALLQSLSERAGRAELEPDGNRGLRGEALGDLRERRPETSGRVHDDGVLGNGGSPQGTAEEHQRGHEQDQHVNRAPP
jgi:hypothetical protein